MYERPPVRTISPPPYPSPLAKKALQQLCSLALADAAIDFGSMQAGRRGKIAHAVLDRAAFCIEGPEVEPADARQGNCRRAHRTGLERHMEIAVDQPLAAERHGRTANCDHLGMGGGIAVGQRSIAGLRHDLPG